MRIVAELPHPECKISIYSMNQKFIVKLEQGPYEQSYKIEELNLTDGINELFQLLDDAFIQTAIERFKSMRIDFVATYNRHQY